MPKNARSFTLTEILIIVVIVGLITAFALPNYGKTVARADERIMITNMLAIKSAVKFYLVNSGDARIPNLFDLDAINDELKLLIIDTKSTYRCWGSGGEAANRCQARHPNGWVIHFHDEYENLHCTTSGGNSCPSCERIPQAGTLGCGV